MKKAIVIAASLAIAVLTACRNHTQAETPSPDPAPSPTADASVVQAAEPTPSADVLDPAPSASVDPDVDTSDPVAVDTPAPTPESTPAATPEPTMSAAPSPVVTPIVTSKPATIPTATATPTAEPTPTPAPVPPPTPTPTPTPTPLPVLTPSPDKDYSNPLAYYLKPVSAYDAMKIQEEMTAYAKSIGLVHVNLNAAENIPSGYNLTYSIGTSTCYTTHTDPYDCAANYKNNLKTAIDNAKTIMLSEGNEYMYFDFQLIEYPVGDIYEGVVTYMHRIGDLPETTNEDSTVIDAAALEAYGRQYAKAMYGYNGRADAGFDTNAGYFPPSTWTIPNMAEGYRIMREDADCQYLNDIGVRRCIMLVMDGNIYHRTINFYLKPTDDPNRFTIYCFYGGE